MKKIKFIIESDLKNTALIGMAINKLCSAIPFSEVNSYLMELSVIEAINNSIIHGYEMEPNHEVTVIFSLYKDRVVFDVCDTGKPMDPDCLKNADISLLEDDHKSIDEISEKGRGLAIIKKVMDEVSYSKSKGKKYLTMIKKITDKS